MRRGVTVKYLHLFHPIMTAIRPATSMPLPDALRLGVEYKTEQRSVGATVKVKDFHTNEVVGQLMYTRFEPHRVPVDAPTRPRVDVTV
jgi:hypothetical protein